MQGTPLVGRALWGRLLRNRSFVIGAVLVFVMVAVALAAAFVALCPSSPDGLAEIAASNPVPANAPGPANPEEDQTDVL